MTVNVDRYTKDLDALLRRGQRLNYAMLHECAPQEFAWAVKEQLAGC